MGNSPHPTIECVRLPAGLSVFQCAANFSEGKDPATIDAIADGIRSAHEAWLADYSFDPDHNRSVFTILGSESGVTAAIRASAAVAVERIDLRRHSGMHPRIGAVDVVPIVPIRHASYEDAVALSRVIALALAEDLSLPVYLYEQSARPGKADLLPVIRQGGFEAIRDIPLAGERQPDYGPSRAHATAGAAVVGARAPLAAYNINLEGPDDSDAQAIARRIRSERDSAPVLSGVRALGFYLPHRQCAQVSMNLTRTDETTLNRVFAYVRSAAQDRRAHVRESEVIGLIPASVLAGNGGEAIMWRDYRPAQIIENWLSG